MQHRFLAAICRVLLTLLVLSTAVRVLPAGAQAPDASLAPGMTALVSADGDCLRLREEPGVTAPHLTCIPDGSAVSVLEGVQELEAYTWRQIEYAGLTGWVADTFLVPYDAPVLGESCTGESTGTAGFTGLYAGGGISIATWGGGNTVGMVSHSLAAGCALQSVWVTASDGGLVGYIAGAPDFVNESWYSIFPGGDVPAGQHLIVRCEPVDNSVSHPSIANLVPSTAAPPRQVGTEAPPEIGAAAAIVVDGASGEVLYEKRAYEPLPPASLTKILTAIMVLEGADLDTLIQTDVDGRLMGDSSLMGIRAGDCFTIRDLLYGLMLPSGNDAATAVAQYMAGSEEAFVAQMNTRARQLGLESSTFTDVHGLGSETHRMSAYDVALLSRYAMSLPTFREVVSTSSYITSGSRTLTLYNINTFLTHYLGADGVKTGYTEEAGRTLSASASRDGHRIFAVVLNAPERNDDAAALLDWAFANFAW